MNVTPQVVVKNGAALAEAEGDEGVALLAISMLLDETMDQVQAAPF
jgi:hypothetical protein